MARKSPEDLAKLVGRRIRELRLERAWNQIDLEAHVDGVVTRSSISYIENGKIFPSRDTLHALAEAFEVSEAAFFLDPNDRRDAIALAALTCRTQILPALEKLLDVETG